MTAIRKAIGWLTGIGGALLAGGVIRAVFLWQSSDSPFFTNFVADAADLDRWAAQISAGNLLGSEVFFRAPFYPYLLGFFYWLTDRQLTIVHIMQHLIGLGGVWATARLALRFWDRRTAVVTAWIAACYPTMIFFEGQMLLDFLLVAVIPVLLLAVERTQRTGSRRTALAAGLLIGLFAITRPTILATTPLFAAWLFWGQGILKQRTRMQRIALIGLMALGAVLVIAPVTARNVLVGGDSVVIASQGGVNFYIGNNSEADGISAALPPFGTAWTNADARAVAENAAGRVLRPSQISAFWAAQGRQFWIDAPIQAFRLTLRKCGLFWQDHEFANNLSIGWFTARWGQVLHWIPLSFGFVVAVGIWGWITTLRARPDRRWLLAWSVVYSLTIVMFFVVSRFRLPLLPVWIGAAAAGVLHLWDKARAGQYRALAVGFVLVLTLFGLARVNWFDLPQGATPRSFLTLGNVYLQTGALNKARAALHRGLALDSGYRGLWLSLGTTHYLDGAPDSAAYCFREELKTHPGDPAALTNLAQVTLDYGDTTESLTLSAQALARQRYFRPAAILTARILRAQGQPGQAAMTLRNAGITPEERSGASLLWGVILLETGEFAHAEYVLGHFLDVSKSQGNEGARDRDLTIGSSTVTKDRALAHFNLGVIAGYRRNWSVAITCMRAATEVDPDLGPAWSNLATAYLQIGDPSRARECSLRAVAINPDNAIYWMTAALSHLALADTVAAADAVAGALRADTSFAPARALQSALAGSGR